MGPFYQGRADKKFTGIRFGLRCGERGEPRLRLGAHPPLANPEPPSEHEKRRGNRGNRGVWDALLTGGRGAGGRRDSRSWIWGGGGGGRGREGG
jgi:hypothetical protein